MVSLKASADVLVSATTPKFAAQAIRKTRELDWKPLQFVANASSSIATVLTPAGLGVYSWASSPLNFLRRWAIRLGERQGLAAFAKKVEPQDNPQDFRHHRLYVNASMLEACPGKDAATRHHARENLSGQVADIDMHLPFAPLPSIVLKTTAADFRAFRSLQYSVSTARWSISIDPAEIRGGRK